MQIFTSRRIDDTVNISRDDSNLWYPFSNETQPLGRDFVAAVVTAASVLFRTTIQATLTELRRFETSAR